MRMYLGAIGQAIVRFPTRFLVYPRNLNIQRRPCGPSITEPPNYGHVSPVESMINPKGVGYGLRRYPVVRHQTLNIGASNMATSWNAMHKSPHIHTNPSPGRTQEEPQLVYPLFAACAAACKMLTRGPQRMTSCQASLLPSPSAACSFAALSSSE